VKTVRAIGALLATLALAGACTQAAAPSHPSSAGTTGPSAAAPTTVPSATPSGAGVASSASAKTVRIALVRQLAEGDYFQQWLAGAQAQANKLGVQLLISDASGDNAKQALDMQTAINEKPDAIIVDHGFAQTMDPPIKQALDAGIPVICFDVDPGDSRAIVETQSDHDIAQLGLNQMLKDIGGKGQVLYVYVAGYAPLDARNEVWKQVKAANPGIIQVAQIGAVNQSTAETVADQAKAALQAHPSVVAIFAPYDEFAKGAVMAVDELGLQTKIKVYGADISTADIGVMTAPNSPWVATVAADPANVGAVAVRAAYVKATGGNVPPNIVVPVALITQQALVSGHVKNMAQLAQAIPELETPNLIPVP
jgi:simple sugar transport system substrate-binding protein